MGHPALTVSRWPEQEATAALATFLEQLVRGLGHRPLYRAELPIAHIEHLPLDISDGQKVNRYPATEHVHGHLPPEQG